MGDIVMVMVIKSLMVTTKGAKSSPMEVTERKDMVIGTKDTCLNNRTRRDTKKRDTATTNKVMNMSNNLMAINDHPTDTRRKVTATKRKITDISNHLMEDTSKRGMAIKTETTMTTKTMGTKDHLTEDTRKRITDMSKKSMVTTIKSTDTSKRGMDTNVRTTAISNHLTEGTKRAMITGTLDTEIGVMEPDMDKLDTEITVTNKLHTQVATMTPMVTRKDILNTLHITSTPSTHTVVITTRENMEARTNLLPISTIMILE